MNENPYASPEPVVEEEHVDELEEARRLMMVRSGLKMVRSGLKWVLASGVLYVFAMMNLPPLLSHAWYSGNWEEWLVAVGMLAMWLVPLTWGMGLCLRCPRRIVPEAVWLIVMSLVLTFAGCAGMVMMGTRAWPGAVAWSVGVAGSGLLWQGFLWQLARGLRNPGCTKLAIAVIVLWSLMWVGVVTQIGLLFFPALIGYVVVYLALLWNLRASALFFGELGR